MSTQKTAQAAAASAAPASTRRMTGAEMVVQALVD